MPSKWYCGSGWWYGSQTVSSLKTTLPSMTAAHLAIAAAEIEADPAAFEVTAERRRSANARGGSRRGLHDLERPIEHRAGPSPHRSVRSRVSR